MGAGANGWTAMISREFDLLLIGSGVAATLVAQRVLQQHPGASILILEAGPRIPSRDRAAWWGLVLDKTTPYQWTYDRDDPTNPDCESLATGKTAWAFKESRVRAFGGSTMHWGGWALRYKEEDFNCRARTGRGADWPLGYGELEPWYALAEEALGVGGRAGLHSDPWRSGGYPLPHFPWSANEAELAAAMEALGLEPGHMPIARFRRCMTTGTCKYCPLGSRYSAQDHLDEIATDPRHAGLQILTGAPVRRILVDGYRAVGVEYVDPITKGETVVHAQRVVVCAGTYESTKLLLASRSADWPDGIGNKTDQVGRNIVTHLMIRTRGKRSGNARRLFQEYDFPTLMSRSWDTPDRQRNGKVFVFNDRGLPNYRFEDAMIAGLSRADMMAAFESKAEAGLHAFIEEFGEPHNRLTLAAGSGLFGLPRMEVSFSRPPEVEETITRVVGDIQDILEEAGYSLAEFRLEKPRGDHASGSLRMGVDEALSVTNAELQIHGFENLFVCSNAVLPNAAAVNPTLTLSALALRLGSRLGADT